MKWSGKQIEVLCEVNSVCRRRHVLAKQALTCYLYLLALEDTQVFTVNPHLESEVLVII